MSTAIFPSEAAAIQRREAGLLRLAFLFLALTSIALLVSRIVRFGEPQAVISRLPLLMVPLVWGLSAMLAHRVLARVRPWRDPLLLPVAMLLTGWGLLSVWRISPEFGARQTAWFLVGVVVLLEVLRGPMDLRWLRRYRYVWLTGGILLAALTLVLGTHPSGGEPRLWLGCCGFYIQPSEPLRLLLLAYLASFLAERMSPDRVSGKGPLLPTLAPLLVMWGLSIALLAVQRDLGTGTLLVALLALMLYVATGRWQVLLTAAGLALVGGILGYAVISVVHQRLDSWLNPWADPIGSSYQIVQSLIAIASGGVFGRGPGMGAPTLVPVVHTDFIYAAVTEEWGLLGGVAMIGLLAVLVSRGLRVAARSHDPFAVMLSAGISLAIGLQSILILGGVIRMLPLTGITLPFVSYGGSSLVTSYLSLAFVLILSGGERRGSPYTPQLRRVGAGLLGAWAALALVTGWWSVYRSPVLTGRTDNARRSLAELLSPRGRIVDRRARLLAETVGERGAYTRVYPEPSAYSLVGYDSPRYAQAGIEEAMDSVLRGESGHDAWTIWWSHLLAGTPPRGLDVRLTVDLDLQSRASALVGDRRGAIVILDPDRGDILALLSSPTYDPNRLDEDWEELTAREDDAPLLNRATQARYQPGTALAPFILAWAEREGQASVSDPAPRSSVPLAVDGQTLACLTPLADESAARLGDALRAGCPSPFADLGAALGGTRLAEMLSAFGFDEIPVIGVEAAGTQEIAMPDDPAQMRLDAAGQGGLRVTPLQLARAFAAFVSGGDLPSLRAIDAVHMPGGEWAPVEPAGIPTAVLSRDVAQHLTDALRLAGRRGIGLVGQAISGPESSRVAWFLGGVVDRVSGRVVVVLLEDAPPAEAQRIGQSILSLSFP